MKKGRKASGGRYKPSRKKKKYELPGIPRVVKLRKTKRKTIRTLGGKGKSVLLACEEANITDQKGKTKVTKIKNVLETSANRFWARQNILVKGALIETELVKARITNRPGQEGCINAVLVKE
jgi:small subunit ribosomal protein S8e